MSTRVQGLLSVGRRAGPDLSASQAEDGGGAAEEGGRAGPQGVHPAGAPAPQAAEAHAGHGRRAQAPPAGREAEEAAPQVHPQRPRGLPQNTHPGPSR